MRRLVCIAGIGLFLMIQTAHAARATDGVVPIDQARALSGGVSVGDDPGFPITITTPGSYRLVGNLSVGTPNVNSIDVTVPGVVLDLNGFTIAGPVACTGQGSKKSCGQGSSYGIRSADRVTVRNGEVHGFQVCVHSGRTAQLSELSITHCGTAVEVYRASRVERNRIENVYVGIQSVGSQIEANSVNDTGANGINAFAGSMVIGNRVTNTGAYALFADYGVDRSGHGRNAFLANRSGPVQGGTQMEPNLCDGDLC